MKKMMLLGALTLSAVAGYTQESRQDVSLSASGIFAPQVNGNAVRQTTTTALGALASYRYLLTPRSGLEANYGFAQNSQKYSISSLQNGRIHSRQQEVSAAYVYNRSYHNFNPFIEAGVGAMIFSPLRDYGSNQLDVKRQTNIGALFGGGVAYEISPSFDIRAEYRGFVVKSPDFSCCSGNNFKTNVYTVYSSPSIGVAYHF